ncbi:MAG: glycolate oxidase subunit GlcE [Pseudomonadota bacterium]|nr:glycolate oxidase subunit GlcE [Pseudomonadota bacterium]
MPASADEFVRSLQERVRTAAATRTPLLIRAGGSKDFYGNAARALHDVLDPRPYCGVIDYEPTELVITARSGTPLSEVECSLAKHNQMLAFEPPHFGASATLGGSIASGLAGPRRMTTGPIRDFVLGATLLDGQANVLSFGGKVMKNVAGYDVSRSLAGSLGTLGVILDVSLKVVPRPATEQTMQFDLPEADAIERANQWAGQPLPISATAWLDGVLSVRLSGSNAGVRTAQARLGGTLVADPAALWIGLREQTHAFFHHTDNATLWRLSVLPTAPPLNLGVSLIEWRGGQRWVWSNVSAAEVRSKVEAVGGHATAFRCRNRDNVFHPLAPTLAQIHRRLKNEFDPAHIFNPGRMYFDL